MAFLGQGVGNEKVMVYKEQVQRDRVQSRALGRFLAGGCSMVGPERMLVQNLPGAKGTGHQKSPPTLSHTLFPLEMSGGGMRPFVRWAWKECLHMHTQTHTQTGTVLIMQGV